MTLLVRKGRCYKPSLSNGAGKLMLSSDQLVSAHRLLSLPQPGTCLLFHTWVLPFHNHTILLWINRLPQHDTNFWSNHPHPANSATRPLFTPAVELTIPVPGGIAWREISQETKHVRYLSTSPLFFFWIIYVRRPGSWSLLPRQRRHILMHINASALKKHLLLVKSIDVLEFVDQHSQTPAWWTNNYIQVKRKYVFLGWTYFPVPATFGSFNRDADLPQQPTVSDAKSPTSFIPKEDHCCCSNITIAQHIRKRNIVLFWIKATSGESRVLGCIGLCVVDFFLRENKNWSASRPRNLPRTAM